MLLNIAGVLMEKALVFYLRDYSKIYKDYFQKPGSLEENIKEVTEYLQNLLRNENADCIYYDKDLFSVGELVGEFVKDFNAGWQPKETL
jgi:hypothetical protein